MTPTPPAGPDPAPDQAPDPAPAPRPLPPDDHVHSEWSYDAVLVGGSMERTCARAVALGLPSVAFTEHADFTVWAADDPGAAEGYGITRPKVGPLDVEGYLACVERCRDLFPGLRIRSGVETGEAHLFAGSVDRVLARGPFERILGSLHAVPYRGRLTEPAWLLANLPVAEAMERYLTELMHLIEGSDVFQVLAHVDYPQRYWPRTAPAFAERDHEEGYREVFARLAASGRALEINTKSPLASVPFVRWWYEAGGDAVSFGSDAHQPGRVGDRFEVARDVAEAAGFRPGRDRHDFWRR